ncbi:ester cyclase [Streptomyces sp. BE20]|uniref:ester cyclase n=1 Tax=Streptomyces sp. BE20 TaxID=3002525 RepID=UPI003FA7E29C
MPCGASSRSCATPCRTLDDRGGRHRGRAAVAWRITGTFNGTGFQGFEPNGRAFDIHGVDFMDVDSGRVRLNRVAFDGAEWARRLGLLPPRGSAAECTVQAAFNLRTRVARRWHERRRAAGRRPA